MVICCSIGDKQQTTKDLHKTEGLNDAQVSLLVQCRSVHGDRLRGVAAGGPPSENTRRSTVDLITHQQPEPGETGLVIPHYVNGSGWAVQLVIRNVDSPAQLVLELFDLELKVDVPSLGSRVLRCVGI